MAHDRSGPAEEPAEEEDTILEARIRHALEPYADLLPENDLGKLREMVVALWTTHPALVPILDRLRARPAENASGERPRKTPEALEAAANRIAKRGKAS